MSNATPRAKKVPKSLTHHGHTRIDDYYWMRDDDRQNPEVLAHLEAENSYAKDLLKPYFKTHQELMTEMHGRLLPHIKSVPYFSKGYWYSYSFLEGKDYPVYYQQKGDLDAPLEVLMDCNAQAKDKSFYALGDLSLSTDRQFLAFCEDTDGARKFTLYIKDLTTGTLLPERIENISSFAWASDHSIYYVKNHAKTLLPDSLYRHVIGTPVKSDELIYKEKDTTFVMSIGLSESEKYLFLTLDATVTSETRILRRNTPGSPFQIFWPRVREHEYHVDHYQDHFYVLSNGYGKNFGLGRCHDKTIKNREDLEVIVAATEEALLGEYYVFNNWLTYEEQRNGLAGLRYINLKTKENKAIAFTDGVYSVWISAFQNRFPEQADYATLRIGYASLSTPDSVFEINLATGDRKLLQQTEIIASFPAHEYHADRLWITARDGVKVPVSYVYKRDLFQANGTNPLLLYGYGAYGHSIDPSFDNEAISLLDRGFVYAIAHIRGGEELGRSWYENGRQEHKKNSFNDFIDVTKGLVAAQIAASDRIFAMGASAGGLLMSAVLNEAPHLYRGVVSGVPFVDCLTTMLDDTIPLTTQEYDEWGDPNKEKDYKYILSYSPYDQIKRQDYPAILVTSSLNDSQVAYWEPAKWVAKMREYKTDNNPLLFLCDLETGHAGKSGRFKMYEDVATEFSFILWINENSQFFKK